jgi:hypothetical protein
MHHSNRKPLSARIMSFLLGVSCCGAPACDEANELTVPREGEMGEPDEGWSLDAWEGHAPTLDDFAAAVVQCSSLHWDGLPLTMTATAVDHDFASELRTVTMCAEFPAETDFWKCIRKSWKGNGALPVLP